MEEETNKNRGTKVLFVVTVLLSVSVLSVAILANSWKEDLRVRDIRVEGNGIVTAVEIVERSGLQKGEKLFEVNLYAARRRVLENHFIRDAVVRRDAPDRIVIVVEERLPAAALLLDNLYYVDAEGYVLPPNRSEKIFDIPVISGVLPKEQLVAGRKTTESSVHEALDILSVAKEIDDGLFRQISEIRLDGERDIIFYTAEEGIPVLFGHGDTGLKLLKFSSFWRNIVMHQGLHGLQYIDLRFDDQVVVRWDKDLRPMRANDAAGQQSFTRTRELS